MHKLNLDSDETVSPTYAARSFSHDIPKYRLPAQGMSANAAYQLVHDELNLDGNPALNLASFVTNWMEPQADLLAAETLAKNLIDQDEYPQSEVVHQRVVSMIGRLFHAPAGSGSTGTATIGSSEAIMLAMLAHKRSWQLRREAEGAPTDRPNMVMGADVHTCWEKFARYFEVEPRVIPMQEGRYTIGAEQVEPLLDERTIGVAGVLGTTFTGQMDDLASIDALLARVEAERGWRIPLHVDAASGGFIVPFSEPELEWDFRLARVRSINVSNHKFGMVYPGMGTVVFRDAVRPARGAGLPHQLPRRRHAQLLAELLARLELGGPAVLQPACAWAARATSRSSPPCWPTPGAGRQAWRHRRPRAAQRRLALPDRRRAREPTTPRADRPRLRSRTCCASEAGSFRPTRCRRTPSTSPCFAWSSRRTSPATWSTCSPTTWPPRRVLEHGPSNGSAPARSGRCTERCRGPARASVARGSRRR